MSENKVNPYEINETMREIGAQDRASILAMLRDGMNDIAAARPYTTTHETAIDFMIYGYLQGRRIEHESIFGGVLPCSMTEPQTAPQSNDEADRRVYIDSLPVSEVAPMMEAVKLWEYSSWHEIRFCMNMAKLYGCKPIEADVDNFNNFLVALYHYGRVQGIRAERAKRNRR